MGAAQRKEASKAKLSDQFTLKEKLGEGNFAIVRRAVRKADHQEFAVKCIKKRRLKPEELQATHDEVEILQKIHHPNCVQLFAVFDTKKDLYMVMELLTGGELFDRIVEKESFSEKQAVGVIKSVAEALSYLHANGISHRDLKPENLLLSDHTDNATIKLTDFGLAKFRFQGGPLMITACGTPGYVAPEVLKGHPYGTEVDVWSLGVILYILLCGFPPFYHPQTAELYKAIKAGKYDFPDEFFKNITDNAKDLIRRCLTVQPEARITSKGILSHPWIVGKAATRALGSGFTENLRVLQCKRRLRRTVQAIVALVKFKSALDDILAQVEAAEALRQT
eukprot:gb/GEZN01006481.1/.p1 GENE.gb/GEZN01006481.1/~~gb/GEZN01006481.1/.p1  ORF type:complete len:336 (+),score=52.33 gb/GEZN01006481.1/:70-1077(+)